jgi:SAM-dependent methyltransferase
MTKMSGIPVQRFARAAARRLDSMSGRLSDQLDRERKLECNACGASVARFVRFAGKPNLCPVCGSPAKERLVLALLDEGALSMPTSGRVLHLAPSERWLAGRLRAEMEWVPADLHPEVYRGFPVRGLDIVELADRRSEFGRFDMVYASHVLEHVPDDRAAMRSIAAALVDDGELWVLVPLAGDSTVEGSGRETVRQREVRFGQWDHVRQYGNDIEARLTSAGFSVLRLGVNDLMSTTVARAGLAEEDVLWRCVRA